MLSVSKSLESLSTRSKVIFNDLWGVGAMPMFQSLISGDYLPLIFIDDECFLFLSAR